MLKKLVADINTVDEKYRIFYTEQTDGTFKLDDALSPDDSGLKSTNLELKKEKIKLKEQMDALQAKIDADHVNDLEGKEKYDELLETKTTQFNDKMAAATLKTAKLENALKERTINSAITDLAITLAGDRAELLKPHLGARFEVEIVDDEPVLKILDDKGQAGTLTKEQLIEEFKKNKMFAPILKGRDSSGGGSGGGSGGDDQADAASWEKYFNEDNSEYNTEKQDELKKKDKGLHDSLVKKFGLDDPYRV